MYDGGYGYSDGGPQRGSSRTAWIIAALIVTIIVVAGAGVAVWLLGRGPSGPAPAAVDDFTTANSAEPSTEDAGATPATTEVAPQQHTTPQSSTTEPQTKTSPSNSYPAGLSARGWDGALNCNAADDWVYAGSNGSDYALICVATPGGGLYYKGIFRGGAAEHDIAAQAGVGTSNAFFETVPTGDATISISGSDLYVYDTDGQILAQTSFGQVYAQ